MKSLEPGTVLDVNEVDIDHQPVEQWQRVGEEAKTGHQTLDASLSAELGLWEMSEGTMLDIEADEVFLVISGTASVEFLAPALPAINLSSGSIVRLTKGMRTRWTVTSKSLRKLYFMPAIGSGQEHE